MPRGVRSIQARPGQDHYSEAGIIEANEQLIFTPFPCHRHPASGHPLRDMPANRGLPARHPQRDADRALPAGPSRSAWPSRPVRSAARPSTSPAPSLAATVPTRSARGHRVWSPTDESPHAYPPLSGRLQRCRRSLCRPYSSGSSGEVVIEQSVAGSFALVGGGHGSVAARGSQDSGHSCAGVDVATCRL